MDNGNADPRTLSSNHWPDWVNLVLAAWLFISPGILNFGGSPTGAFDTTANPVAASHADWNAWVLSILIFIVACSAIAQLRAWHAWLTLLLGVWVFVAPWALSFTVLSGAAWDHWIVGALVVLMAAANLRTMRGTAAAPPTASEPSHAGNKPAKQP